MNPCPVCNHENKAGARFCARCGAPLAGEPESLAPGQLVDGGTYRIIRPLGKGGMGAVYLAANTKAFDRQVVVKEVIEYYDPADPQERQKAIERFEAEARTLASLKHPGIPDIYAYFTERGRNYLVMEYIEGPDLADGLTHEDEGQIVSGQPLPVQDVIRHTIRISQVLDYLEKHQPPVMHNDIKPANVILDKNSGQAVLVDFGTARSRYARQLAGQPGLQHSSVYGTVGYAAPELYDGRAEPRSDVYSLAATAYHLLTDDDPRAHPFKFPKMDQIPAPLRQALQEALDNDVNKRPAAAQLDERMNQVFRQLYPQAGSGALVPPLTFPEGAMAMNRREMVALAIQNWAFARDILYDGSIAHWLRDALHDPVAARAAEEAVDRHPEDRDAGLEALIRNLDPQALPAPQISLPTSSLRYERPAGQDASQRLEIANTGGGVLKARVTASAPWIKVGERVQLAPGQSQALPVIIDTRELKAGHVYQARVQIEAPGLPPETVPVEVKLPPPQIVVAPARLELVPPPRGELLSERVEFSVHNQGAGRADCQISGDPSWLVIDPQRFSCPPGETRVVEIRARIDKLPKDQAVPGATLLITPEGARGQQVQVSVRTGRKAAPAPSKPANRAGAAIAIGCAVLVLIGAVVWFVVSVLPLLL